jgi:hypothetical protein
MAHSLVPSQTTATSSRLAPPQGVPLSGLRYFLAKPPRSPKGLEIVPLRAWRLGERLFSGRKWNGRSVPNGAKLRGYCHLNPNPNLDLNLLMENGLRLRL